MEVLPRVYPLGSLHPMQNVYGMAYVPMDDITATREHVARLESQVAALQEYLDMPESIPSPPAEDKPAIEPAAPPRNRFLTHPHYWAGVAVALAVMAVLVVVGSW